MDRDGSRVRANASMGTWKGQGEGAASVVGGSRTVMYENVRDARLGVRDTGLPAGQRY